ncbi:MAG: hypothetical protein Q9214_003269 [Letrouitia sp. 1 TL-2023]
MPHSPYRKTIYPPISDLDEYKRGITQHRVSLESGERNKYWDEELLDIGELLVEHCDFLNRKLDVKVIIHLLQLTKENDKLKTELEAWKTGCKA